MDDIPSLYDWAGGAEALNRLPAGRIGRLMGKPVVA